MTAETNECNGVSEGSKIEFVEKRGLSSSGDLENAIDRNGISCDNVVANDVEVSDDADGSYIFVKKSDTVSDGPVLERHNDVLDAGAAEMESVVEENGVLESNVGPSSEAKQVKSEELRSEKEEKVESSLENGCAVVEVADDCLHAELESAIKVEEYSESQITDTEAVESELSLIIEKGKDTEASNVADQVEEPTGDLRMVPEVKLDKATCLIVDGDTEIETEVGSGSVKCVANSPIYDMDTETEVGNGCVESGELAASCPDGLRLENEVVNGSVHEVESETEVRNRPVEIAFSCPDGLQLENEVVNSSIHEVESETEVRNGSVEIASSCPDGLQLENEVVNGSIHEVESETEVRNGPVEIASSCPDGLQLENEVVNSSIHEVESETEVRNGSVEIASSCPDGLQLENEVVNSSIHEVESETEVRNGSVEIASSCPDGLQLENEVINGSIHEVESETEVRNGSVEIASSGPDGLQLENEVVNGSIHEVESETEVRNGSVETGECMPTCLVNDVESVSEVRDESVESGKRLHDCPVDDTELETKVLETEIGNGSIENDEIIVPACPVDDIKLDHEVRNGTVESREDLPISHVDGVKLEDEVEVRSGSVENGSSTFTNVNGVVDGENDDLSVNRNGDNKPICDEVGGLQVEFLPSSQEDPSTANVSDGEKVDPVDVENEDQNVDRNGDNTPISENVGAIEGIHSNGIQPSSQEDSSCADDSAEQKVDTDVVDAENEDLSVSRDCDNKPICDEVGGVEGSTTNEVLPSSQEDSSSADALDGQKVDSDVGKRIYNFIIRIPRYVDDKFRAQIGLAQLQVDEKTQNRDSIRREMQMKKATCSEYREKFEAARLEERAARDAVNAKRQEIDSIQLMINRMKNATSVDDIDNRIHSMEHLIQHETMPLKDEKQLIREIKQLKNAREQLLANMSTQAELQEAFDQRDTIEDRFRLLKQELETLRKEVLRTEGITKAAKKKYQDECEILNDLQAQFRAADDLRQETYTNLQHLKKQLYEKNKYFRMYKEDQKAAADYASKGDRKTLECHCDDQVEKFMELWNNNEEFRSEYVKHNVMSTLRRLKTLDGRSLGPDEEPPVLRNFVVEERISNVGVPSAKINPALRVSTNLEKIQEKPGPLLVLEKVDLKPAVMVEQKNPVVKSKKSTKLSSVETNSVTVSTREEVEEEAEKDNKRTKEEEELARKEELLRKEEDAAKLKEQRRLEEKAKAKEAEERKRRNAEKAQARAALRAQKEAELKEKEREKRAKKKERKKVGATEAMNGGIQGEFAPSTDENSPDTIREPEIKEKLTTVTKRSMKPMVSAKLTKSNPLPLPLRNRGKRKMQPWMWAVLAALVILALFLASNYAFTFESGLPKFGF